MRTYFINRWDAVRVSFWFVPALMCVASLVLVLLCKWAEQPVEGWLISVAPWMGMTAAAVRGSLSTVASAMVSMAGIVFSVMLVTLSITSSQYGSRLLRTFMSDRVTQGVLGVLVGTSLFCLLATAGIQDRSDEQAPANVSIVVGMLLALLSLAVLIGFIHHVANLIQAPNVVAAVAADLDDSFHRLFPRRLAERKRLEPDQTCDCPRAGSGSPVLSKKEGYLQAIDGETLLAIARSHDLFLRLRVKPGEFIERDETLVEFWPSEVVSRGATARPRDDAPNFGEHFSDRVNATVITGRRRTPRQDAECALEELVEVAVRALSPGINDPFTAIACIDRLAASLGRAAERAMPQPLRFDDQGVPRILARATTFPSLMDAAFNQLRQHGSRDVAVAIRLAQALKRVAAHASTDEQRQSIRRHALMLERDFRQHVSEPEDGDDFQESFAELTEWLGRFD